MLAKAFGFFNWVGISHYLNLLLLGFLIRSGLQVLSAHPKLYWNEHCAPGSEWLRLTRKQIPSDRLWTATDEEDPFSSWVALPGGRNLGVGRHWHLFCVIFWVLNGLAYVALLFVTGEWRRLLPTTTAIVPEAAQTAWTYLQLRLPVPGHPYNPLQQLTYAAVIFLLAPALIATGAAMSPAVAARFPWYLRVFGGRQAARSLHFLALLAITVFAAGHIVLVAIDDFPRNMAWIIHGEDGMERVAVGVGLAGLVAVGVMHALATKFSLRHPDRIQQIPGGITTPVHRILLHHVTSRQQYSMADVGSSGSTAGRLKARSTRSCAVRLQGVATQNRRNGERAPRDVSRGAPGNARSNADHSAALHSRMVGDCGMDGSRARRRPPAVRAAAGGSLRCLPGLRRAPPRRAVS
jgi:methionine sulfoxide reductase catalytic subunit